MGNLFSKWMALALFLTPFWVSGQIPMASIEAVNHQPETFDQGVYLQGKFTRIYGKDYWVFEGYGGHTIQTEVALDVERPPINKDIAVFGYLEKKGALWILRVRGWTSRISPPVVDEKVVSWASVENDPEHEKVVLYKGTLSGPGLATYSYYFDDGSAKQSELHFPKNMKIPEVGTEIYCLVAINCCYTTFHDVILWQEVEHTGKGTLEEQGFIIYPNPTSQYLNIQTERKGISYSLRSENGRSEYRGVLTEIGVLDVMDLKRGTYILTLSDKYRVFGSMKITIQ